MRKFLSYFISMMVGVLMCACSSSQSVGSYSAYDGMQGALSNSSAAVSGQQGGQTAMTSGRNGDHYRRNSLCLIMLAHSDKQYAEAMTRVFQNFPLPNRYNEHNISSVRVLRVKGKQTRSDIERMLRREDIARRVVSRWFDRDAGTGSMDMDLIHKRGGYGANYDDYLRAQTNVRGTAMLKDEGLELLQHTFVLVCDMDYIDKKKGAAWGAFGLALAGAMMQGAASYSQAQAMNSYYAGNYETAKRQARQANTWAAASTLTTAGAAVVADIGGFRVKMHAYLYKLRWNDTMTGAMFNDYWIDSSTLSAEAQQRKSRYENAYMFQLDYVGDYSAASSKTILRSWSNEDQVILDVTERCVDKGIRELARRYPNFRPRVPFYMQDGNMYALMGRKEDVELGKRYEIVQPYKDKQGQICYKRVGKVKAGTPWNNRNVDFSEYFDTSALGTRFDYGSARVDLNTPGLQLREM